MARVRTILKRTSDGRTIPAVLDDALPRAALFDIEGEWCRERVEVARALDAAGVGRADDEWPESLHWSWPERPVTSREPVSVSPATHI